MGCRLLGTLFGVDGELLERQYRNHLSGYLCWEQLPHAEEWLLFEKNIGAYVGLDEVCLSRGELYTVLINKERKGRSGSLIAVVKGTDVKTVTSVLLRLSRRRRFQVREITMDMAPNMEQIARLCFPAARRVTDRFHVQKLAYEAVQDMRVKARWEALDEESVQIAHAKACGKIYHAPVFENGDSRKQLLSRSIYLLYKKESLWTESQRVRAGILFREYPDIKKAYYLSMRLGLIYHQCRYKDAALTRLARWYDEVEKSGFLAFGRVARSVQMHYREIINFFDRGSTNAASESFNAKIKDSRALEEGIAEFLMIGDSTILKKYPTLKQYPEYVKTIHIENPDEAAREAVRIVREGGADILMKGIINTDNLLHAILDKEKGLLPKGKILTHLAVMEIPTYHKLLFFSDAAVIPRPTLQQRIEMIWYAICTCRHFGIEQPRVALIHCTEKVSAKFPHSLDYVNIVELAEAGEFGNVIIDGPLDVRTACEQASGDIKGIVSPINGQADVLIFPNIESGNAFYKSVSLFAQIGRASCRERV